LILTFAAVINVTANVYSQSVRINLELKNATLEEVFQSIREQAGFYFFYKNEQIPHKKLITKTYKNARVDKVLDEVPEGTGLMYRCLNISGNWKGGKDIFLSNYRNFGNRKKMIKKS